MDCRILGRLFVGRLSPGGVDRAGRHVSPPYSREAWDALRAWKAKAFFTSRDVFSVVWALALAGVGMWGPMHSRRSAMNMAATFGGIHFTGWFERLRTAPENGDSRRRRRRRPGLCAVAYNQRQTARAAA